MAHLVLLYGRGELLPAVPTVARPRLDAGLGRDHSLKSARVARAVTDRESIT